MPQNDLKLIQQARQAFSAGDVARGGKIVHGILKGEITHPEAWSLLYTYLGRGKSFDEFQDHFVRSYYLDQYDAFKVRKAALENGPFRRVSLAQNSPFLEEGNGKLDFPRPKTGPAPATRQIKEEKEKGGLNLRNLFRLGKAETAGADGEVKSSVSGKKQSGPKKRFRLSDLKALRRSKTADLDDLQAGQSPVHFPQTIPDPTPIPVPVPEQKDTLTSIQAKSENVDLLVKKITAENAVRQEAGKEEKAHTGKPPLISVLGKRSGIRLVIADDIEQTRENIRKLLLFESTVEIVGVAASGREAVDIVTETQPDVVLLDINMPDMDGLRALNLIREQAPMSQVIMLTVQDDPGYLREALQLGARDYLIKPPMIDDLLDTVRKAFEIGRTERERIERLARQQASTLEAATGRVRGFSMAIYSPKGGVGCTVLAANLSVALAASKESVVLVDCNLQYGGVGLLFNQTARTSIAEIAPYIAELDMDVIENACARHAESGVRLLLAPNRLGKGETVTGEQITGLVEFLSRHYAYIVIDTSSALDDLTVSVLDSVDQVLLVTTQDIPSINDIRRVLDLAPAIGIDPLKISLVLNQYHTRINITPEKITANLGREFAAVIPLENATVIPSINRGKPFMLAGQGQSSALGQAVRNLADQILSTSAALEEIIET